MTPRKRVLQVATLAGPGALAGGVWSVCAEQQAALADGGEFHCHTVAGWAAKDYPNEANRTYIRLARPSKRLGLRFLPPIQIRKLVALLRDIPEVVHIHLCRDFFTVFVLLLLKYAKNTVVVAQPHGMIQPPHNMVSRAYDYLLLRRALGRVDKWIYLTPLERNSLQMMGIAERIMFPIANAVREPGLTWTEPSGPPKFLFVGRLHHRKQPHLLVQAAAKLKADGIAIALTFIGPDEGELDSLKDLAARLGLTNVAFLGNMTRDAVFQEMLSSTALVLPSINEPYPMVAIEAASLGMPIIISESTGVSKLLHESSAAIVVDASGAAIDSAMKSLITHPTQAKMLSAAARSTYETNWTHRTLRDSLTHIYKTVPSTRTAQ